MADLAYVLESAMNRGHVSVQTLADRTGIRTPRVRAFVQDGDTGPVPPTEQELRELADALGLSMTEIIPGTALAGVPDA
ncbi:helix-turn-helix domain-containing protein [Streptomyces sp. NPDC058657]|uniref:helix-turn-helix domain-containing protein n=1 Tax=unclassified Streptomyces TaxID=2593676 RepID=UPI00365CE888